MNKEKDAITIALKAIPLFGMAVIIYYVIQLFWAVLPSSLALMGTLLCVGVLIFIAVEALKTLDGKFKTEEEIESEKLNELLAKKLDNQKDVLRRLQRDEEDYLWKVSKARRTYDEQAQKMEELESRLKSLQEQIDKKSVLVTATTTSTITSPVSITKAPKVDPDDLLGEMDKE